MFDGWGIGEKKLLLLEFGENLVKFWLFLIVVSWILLVGGVKFLVYGIWCFLDIEFFLFNLGMLCKI